jgi:Tfp pilus assembly protein PilF
MSLLSDLLSKIRHPEPRRDVPPGLRSMVSTLKKKEFNRRRLALFMAFAVMALGSGFVTVYLVGIYPTKDTKDVKQVAEYKRPISEPKSEQPSLPYRAAHTPEETSRGQVMVNSQEKKVEMVRTQKEGEEKKIKKKVRPEPLKIQKTFEDTSQPVQDVDNIYVLQGRKTQPETVEVANIEKPKVDSSEKDLYLYTAGNYESRKDYPNALASYKKVLDIEPRNYRVMNNIASILLQINSSEEAKTYLQKAFDIKNDYVPGLINMGIALAKLEETEKAEGFLLRAHTLEPDNRRTIFNIAILYEKKGNYEKAREYYLRLQRLGDTEGGVGLERTRDR